jgi:hypothetical protein
VAAKSLFPRIRQHEMMNPPEVIIDIERLGFLHGVMIF